MASFEALVKTPSLWIHFPVDLLALKSDTAVFAVCEFPRWIGCAVALINQFPRLRCYVAPQFRRMFRSLYMW